MADRVPDDEDWLLDRERGDDVSHIAPETRARYEQLDQLIAALAERPPPAGWKQRVLDALDAPAPRSSSDMIEPAASGPAPSTDSPAPRSPPETRVSTGGRAADGRAANGRIAEGRRAPIVRGWRAWILALGGAVVGIVILSVVVPRPQPPRAEPVVTTEIRRGERPHRGDDVSVGDTLVVHAESDQPIELRVYGDGGEPLARCTDTQGCAVERSGAHRRYTLDVLLRAPGDVRTVLFTGDAIPSPGANLDADLDAALAAHVDARQVATVRVE
jgi:hypothetical protein